MPTLYAERLRIEAAITATKLAAEKWIALCHGLERIEMPYTLERAQKMADTLTDAMHEAEKFFGA